MITEQQLLDAGFVKVFQYKENKNLSRWAMKEEDQSKTSFPSRGVFDFHVWKGLVINNVFGFFVGISDITDLVAYRDFAYSRIKKYEISVNDISH